VCVFVLVAFLKLTFLLTKYNDVSWKLLNMLSCARDFITTVGTIFVVLIQKNCSQKKYG
jgi:hypothetical protein